MHIKTYYNTPVELAQNMNRTEIISYEICSNFYQMFMKIFIITITNLENQLHRPLCRILPLCFVLKQCPLFSKCNF